MPFISQFYFFSSNNMFFYKPCAIIYIPTQVDEGSDKIYWGLHSPGMLHAIVGPLFSNILGQCIIPLSKRPAFLQCLTLEDVTNNIVSWSVSNKLPMNTINNPEEWRPYLHYSGRLCFGNSVIFILLCLAGIYIYLPNFLIWNANEICSWKLMNDILIH